MNKSNNSIKKLLNSRSLKYGSNSIILIVIVIAIAFFINMLVSPAFLQKAIHKDAIKWDLTPNKLFTIGDTTKQILKDIKKDVTIYCLFDEAKIKNDAGLKDINELIKQYAGPRIKIEYVDLDKNPRFISEKDPQGIKNINKDDLLFESGKRLKRVSRDDWYEYDFDQSTFQSRVTGTKAEQSFTGAIKYVTSEKTPTVYFLEGHGERKLDEDFKELVANIQYNNFDVKSLNLTTEGKVPADAEILFISAPKSDLTSSEKEAIKEFMKNGGNAIFAFDPLSNDAKLTNFEDVLSAYNVSLNYDKVKENDEKRHFKNKPYDIVPEIQDSQFTKILLSNGIEAMIMSNSRSLNILKNNKEYITVTSLLKTSGKAEGELIDKSKSSIKGPLDLAVSVENKGGAKVSKVIVLGNGSFMTDSAIKQYSQYSQAGLYFLLYHMRDMINEKDSLIIASKSLASPTLLMEARTTNVVALLVVIVFPVIIFGFGTYVWMRRRHL